MPSFSDTILMRLVNAVSKFYYPAWDDFRSLLSDLTDLTYEDPKELLFAVPGLESGLKFLLEVDDSLFCIGGEFKFCELKLFDGL